MTNRITISNPATLPKPAGAYSHIARVTAGDLLFIAGQVATDASGKVVGADDFEAQADQVFANLRAALQSEGADFQHVVQFTTYLVDSRDIAKLRESPGARFRAPLSAWEISAEYPAGRRAPGERGDAAGNRGDCRAVGGGARLKARLVSVASALAQSDESADERPNVTFAATDCRKRGCPSPQASVLSDEES